ncbi:MAG: nitroreductase family protein [Burkholderiales bacterium]|nr:nitroreductase family protein [Burkholderiales bacterium]
MMAVVRHSNGEAGFPEMDKWVSLGAALQNLMLGVAALKVGAGLTSGEALASARMTRLMGSASDEQAACIVSLGTAGSMKRRLPTRPTTFEQELFKQSAGHLADAERPLQTKIAKAATESKRIVTDKID